ncbi:UDP-N-acetylmuramoyl-L-alanyl-D-glutamate--2,6-diaminopimelate ligase [Gynurincola endophyticus]|uniref:UDP-N-acetylmuramoyl-L-alanyl-D-glutamate--2, 6-diaminopimelate ligase n=1 Tax=Gynurincola endophyticus TaxID=2479004 RepID=UPI000F8E95C6|nr:UDP-N-acetylmuramoyl-L-alanyl-D-glutamate--2,6-diaminopimelate ligase [Gynurincola endophyticus]
MPVLQDILYGVSIRAVQGVVESNIEQLCVDSRKVVQGSAFIAVRGVHVDGHQFINKAIELGAVAIILEELPAITHNNVTYIVVENTQEALGIMSHNFYDRPTDRLKLVGVTGTNGKTTIATLLYELFEALEYKCGLLSTVENRIDGKVIPATHTTPDPIQLNELLSEMVKAGCTYAFMETSSHAIHQHRIAGLRYAGAIFSNITHDHLDYHKTFDEYIKVKKKFFDQLTSDAFAITNIDDKRGLVMLQNTNAKKYSYSLQQPADFKGKILENALSGLMMTVDGQEVHFRMIGEFNAYNLLAVYGAAVALGENKQEVLTCLSVLRGAEGRFDYVISVKDKVIGIVDYAHTPDALENVLSTIRKLRKGYESVITVVGCGGDRDAAKRPIMGKVACDWSDRVIFTSDNPRTEDPITILKQMETDLDAAGRRKFISIADRKEAIKTAISLAKPEDIILIAGKGHEKYQDINGVKHPFDDKQVLIELFEFLDK